MAATDLPCPRCGGSDTDFFHGDMAHCRDCGKEWMQLPPGKEPDIPDYPPQGEYHHLQFPGMPPSRRAYPTIRGIDQGDLDPGRSAADDQFLKEHGIEARRHQAVNHEDMSEEQLRAHMRDRHGFIDSPEDPDWLIEQTHKDEPADEPLEHRHPDLERWPEEELAGDQLPLSDRDFLHQHGIEGKRQP